MKWLGLLLFVAGLLVAAWVLLVGLGFSSVLIMGFIGTEGREAGPELLTMLGLTLAGTAFGALLMGVGRWLAGSGDGARTGPHGGYPTAVASSAGDRADTPGTGEDSPSD